MLERIGFFFEHSFDAQVEDCIKPKNLIFNMITNKLFKNYQCFFCLRNYSLVMTSHSQTSKFLCSSYSLNTSAILIRKMTTGRKGGPPKSRTDQPLEKSSQFAPGISVQKIPEKTKRGIAEPIVEHSGFPFFYFLPIIWMFSCFLAMYMKSQSDNYQAYLR